MTSNNVSSFAVSGTNLFAGSGFDGVFLSTNNGANWTAVNNGLTGYYVVSLAVSGINLFAGTSNGGVFLSTNNGTSWTSVNNGLAYIDFTSLAVSGTNVFLGSWGTVGGGVFLSTNNGTSWTVVNNGLTNTDVQSLAVSGENIFAATYLGGVFRTTNNGTFWIAVNSGLTNTDVRTLAISGTHLYASTYKSGVWRRPLSELISVQSLSNEVPEEFSLEQNYPNPFNPVTKINYELRVTNYARLVAYDVMGKEVATLVNEKQSPGAYQVDFDGSSLPSGVYFYRLTAGDFTDTKRMILIR